MCGLVGLVQRFDPQARIDPAYLARASTDLQSWSAEAAGAAKELEEIAQGLSAISLSMVGWAGFRSLREDAALRKGVRPMRAEAVI